MNNRELHLILQEGEGYRVEFKEEIGDLTRELVAFANASGGRIFLGVSDNRTIKGIALSNRLAAQIGDLARNSDPSIPISLVRHKQIAIIEVREGANKPYQCSAGFFLRVGASAQKLTRNEILSFAIRVGACLFDEQTDGGFRYPRDFDHEAFREFLRLSGVSTRLPAAAVLRTLNLAKKSGARLLCTEAGVLFFAREPRRFIPTAGVTCVLFQGTERDTVLDRKEYAAGLIGTISAVEHWLKANLHTRQVVSSLYREDRCELPETAWREILVNMVFHRDYFDKSGAATVEVFADRVVFTNPGGLVPSLSRQDFGRISRTRNPLVGDILARARLGEKLGTGIGKVKAACKKAGVVAPVYDWNEYTFSVTFMRAANVPNDVRENVTKNVTKDVTKTGTAVSEHGQKAKCAERRRQLVVAVARREKFTVVSLALRFAVDPQTVKRDIKQLTADGIIRFVGAPRSGEYRLLKKSPAGRNGHRTKS